MIVVNGCNESQSWSEQRKLSESTPCNQYFLGICPALPSKFIHSKRSCEVQPLEHVRFRSMSVSSLPFREPRAVVAHGLRSEGGLGQDLPTNLRIRDQGRHMTVFHLLVYDTSP